jgi:hypothetical protein
LPVEYGVFANGVVAGRYKLDLGEVKSIARVNTFSFNQGGNRGQQRFVLYGSSATSDPGGNVEDPHRFSPIIDLDTKTVYPTDFVATSVRQGEGKPLGRYRWLVWAVWPVNETADGENTAFQEFQVMAEPASGPSR